jgi:hypothetical protein
MSLQQAIGIFSVATIETAPKQFWTFPQGYGKSFIIAAATLTVLLFTEI